MKEMKKEGKQRQRSYRYSKTVTDRFKVIKLFSNAK